MRAFAAVCFALLCICAHSQYGDYSGNVELRAKYKQAKQARDAGRTRQYEALKAELQDYPLYPYLIYHESLRRISSYSADEAQQIVDQLQDTVLSVEFQRRWLDSQAKAGRWTTYTENWTGSSDPKEQCRYIQALHRIGQKDKAMSMVANLWIVGESQPKECDPIFGTWISNGNVTTQVAWQRLQLAVEEDSRVLARYLMRFFRQPERASAQLLYDVHVKPTLVKTQRRFSNDDWGRTALLHGLREFAKDEGVEALNLWIDYREQFDFEPQVELAMDDHMSFWASREGQLIIEVNAKFKPSTIERIADTAIAQEQWKVAHDWLAAYPVEEQSSYKWRFWSAIVGKELGQEDAQAKLEELAQERTYYGFLAADELGLPIQLNRHEWEDPLGARRQHLNDARIARVFELYAIGDEASATKEWKWLIPQLDEDARTWMVWEIGNIGWTYDSIQAAFSADALDLIETRFPVLFIDTFRRNAHMTNVGVPVLLAITRQESAFNPKAVSTVGARGLMQLMLPTARRTANNMRVRRPTSDSLLDPEINIQLGSHHMLELLEEFDGNHALAYAAYNAGSHRVDDWIEEASGMDTRAWIETIPFYETRNYVKNVIAFVQVYGHVLDIPTPVLGKQERTIP